MVSYCLTAFPPNLPSHLKRDMDKNRILESYYSDNASKLRGIVRYITSRYGIPDYCLDDYYCLANEVFCKALASYNENKSSFDTHISACLSKKIKNELRDRNAYKRKIDLVYDNDWFAGGLSANDDVETVAIMNCDFEKLEKDDRDIFSMRMSGYTDSEIKRTVGMSTRRYYRRLNSIQKNMA